MKFLPLIASIIITSTSFSQTKMLSINELIDKNDSGWKSVKEMAGTAKNKIEILPVDSQKANDALYHTQINTKTTMGAVIYKTGGILVDNGWIRILGSGSAKLNRSLPDWNKGKTFKEFGEVPGYLLIADDALGGFYILNGGALGTDVGKVYYFSPDNLEYEPLGINYPQFLDFCFNNDLENYYEGSRWDKWKDEVAGLKGDQVFNFYPFLWTQEGSDINKVTRKIIPIEEQYSLNIDLRKQMGL
ncbi:DUF2625 domain-containing protein [Flavobacterium sp. KACC 22761]|uniref:DUF2625 domain-containing protein n=1 Tax=Flavobacterium sp. KACC 22761 TaxID=3092665 RepID=UPI002A75A7F7|nr:DUF2625 domain-containing protein [Flavobacterium sp. KACC 22761]WPO78765.1 DUF2625 domain-containing protein [Flavobacterium sp. KACC 22761]